MRIFFILLVFLSYTVPVSSQNIYVTSIGLYNCNNDGKNNVSFKVATGSYTNFTYNWQIKINNILKFSGTDMGTKEIFVTGTIVGVGDKVEVNVLGTGVYAGIKNLRVLNSVSNLNITSNYSPSIAPIITTSSNEICNSIPVNLSIDADPSNTYTWYRSGVPIISQNYFSYDATIPGDYTVIESNSCGSSPVSNIIKLTANQTPPAPLIIASNTTICDGKSVTINAIGLGGTYLWSNSTIGSIINTNTEGSYFVNETNSCGTSPASNIISLNALNIPIVSPITGTFSVCANSSIQLSDATFNGVWSSINVNKAIVNQNGLVTGLASGNVTITYSVTNTCGTGIAQVNILINDAVPIAPVISSPKTLLCNGDSTKITSISPNPFGDIVWNNGDKGLIINIKNAGSYKAYEINACGSSPFSNIITVNTSTNPIVTSIIGNSNVCVGSQIQLINNTNAGIWSSSDISIANISSSGVVTGLSGIKSTVIEYTVTNSCGSSTVTKTIYVNNLPILNISSKIIGSKVELMGTGASLYNWNSGELTSIIQKPLNLSYQYHLIGTDSNGCASSKDFTVDAIPNNASTFISSSLGTIFCLGDSTSLVLPNGDGYFWDSGEKTQIIKTKNTGSHIGYALYTSKYKVETASINLENFPVPSVSPLNDSNVLTFCNNETTPNIIFTGPINGTTFKWKNDNTIIGLQESGMNKIPSFLISNTTNNSIIANISVSPIANGCAGPIYNFKSVVKPTPSLISEKLFYQCDGTLFTYIPKINLNSNFEILWNVKKDNSIFLDNTPNVGVINSKLQNSTSDIKQIQLFATITSLGCVNYDTLNINIVQNPKGVFTVSKSIIKSGELDTLIFISTDSISKSYTWNLGFGIPLVNTSNDFYRISYKHRTDTTNTIFLGVTNRFGCYNLFSNTIKIIGMPDTIPINLTDSLKWQNTLLPVPFNDHLSFRYYLENDEEAIFSFFDTGGFPLYSLKVSLQKGFHQIAIPELWRINKNKVYIFTCNSKTIHHQQLFYGVNY
jgi:hypothetical protein